MYKYPDENDNITCKYIDIFSDSVYWEESEKNVLNIALEEVKKMKNPKMLDLGCGIGRLFKVFEPYVSYIKALEPDISRYKSAVEESKNINKNKIEVINNDISCIKDEKFDVILCSHIFQHMPEKMADEIILKLGKILTRDGILLITTTFSATEDIYSLEYIKNEKHVSEKVTKQEFYKRFNENNVLPVIGISKNTMEKRFKENKLKIVKICGYHFDISIVKNEKAKEFDKLKNKNNDLQKAKDVLYIVKRSL